jgi:outer membrane protein OmpA-like peptidoglycan-associated protein
MFTLKSPELIRHTRLSYVLGCMAICLGLAACQTPPAPPPPVATPVAEYLGPTLPIEQSERGVQIFLPSTVLFDIGKAEFKAAEAQPYLERVAHLLKTKTAKKVSIEGHTDNVGALAPNQALSLARANSLLKTLAERGVPVERLAAVGFAFNRPVASNATPDGRQLNRRVEILILDEKIETITQGEPANAFESAWDKLKKMIEQGLVKPVESKS